MAELNGNEELIELEDEDGSVLTYRLLQELEWNGVTYAILEDTEDDEGYVSVFRVTEDEEGTSYEFVEDEDLSEEVFYLAQAEADDYEIGPAE